MKIFSTQILFALSSLIQKKPKQLRYSKCTNCFGSSVAQYFKILLDFRKNYLCHCDVSYIRDIEAIYVANNYHWRSFPDHWSFLNHNHRDFLQFSGEAHLDERFETKFVTSSGVYDERTLNWWRMNRWMKNSKLWTTSEGLNKGLRSLFPPLLPPRDLRRRLGSRIPWNLITKFVVRRIFQDKRVYQNRKQKLDGTIYDHSSSLEVSRLFIIQYRMHSHISAIVSREFYDERLIDHHSILSRFEDNVFKQFLQMIRLRCKHHSLASLGGLEREQLHRFLSALNDFDKLAGGELTYSDHEKGEPVAARVRRSRGSCSVCGSASALKGVSARK